MFWSPAINIYAHDVLRLVGFYESLGFRETFRTPEEGAPVHVEVTLDGFTIGIAAVDAAAADHGLSPDLGGRPVEIVLWTDDTDRDYERLTPAVRRRSALRTIFSPICASRGWPTRTQPHPTCAAPPVGVFATSCLTCLPLSVGVGS